MPRTKNPYRTEIREYMIGLARSGRIVERLAREFKPCMGAVHLWLKDGKLDSGELQDGVTNAERDELRRLRRKQGAAPGPRHILKGRILVCSGRNTIVEMFRFMTANQAPYTISMMARMLGVSRSGFCA